MTDATSQTKIAALTLLRLRFPLLRRGAGIGSMIPDIGQAAIMAYVAPFQIGMGAPPAAKALPDGRDPRW